MLLVQAMDEGPIIAQKTIPLNGDETTPQLTDILIKTSYSLLTSHFDDYMSGALIPTPQEIIQKNTRKKVSYTRKLDKKDGLIDWNKNATTIEREIRAYTGWPKSRTYFEDINVVITKSSIIKKKGTPGKLFVHEKQLSVHCGEDALVIECLVPAGKKLMTSEAFLAGYRPRLHLKD